LFGFTGTVAIMSIEVFLEMSEVEGCAASRTFHAATGGMLAAACIDGVSTTAWCVSGLCHRRDEIGEASS
jgi:hypothetical protein